MSGSTDGTNFVTVARGTWADDSSLKRTTFTPTNGRWVRIIAETEAGNRGPWASIAEINVDTATGPAPPNPAGKGSWGLTIDVPLVPVSAALQWNNGRLLLWSSYSPSTFGGSPGTTTVTATYDPATQTVSRPVTVTNINHDMFCEGLSIDFNGRFISTGGNTISANSIFDPAANSWARKTVSLSSGYLSERNRIFTSFLSAALLLLLIMPPDIPQCLRSRSMWHH